MFVLTTVWERISIFEVLLFLQRLMHNNNLLQRPNTHSLYETSSVIHYMINLKAWNFNENNLEMSNKSHADS